MANFATSNSLGGTQVAISNAYKTLINAYGGATTQRRGKIYDVLVGTNGTPADNYMEWDISRFSATAILTGTVVTPNPLDTADSAYLGASVANATTENTYVNNGTGASVFYVGVNQRASYRWVVDPGSVGAIVTPATTANGIAIGGINASAAYSSTYAVSAYYQE